MPLTLDDLEYLRTPQAARLLAMDLPAETVQAVSKLRKHSSHDEAAAILTLRELRKRARRSGRFPEQLAGNLLATDKMLQQASSWRVAIHKARQLTAVGDGPVWDLCCGMGVDALAIAAAGRNVTAVDLDPAAVVCTEHNAAATGLPERVSVRRADVTQMSPWTDAIVHADPDRRPTGRRGTSLQQAAPPPRFLAELMKRSSAGVIKLSAAIDPAELAELPPCSREYVSEQGVVKQLLVGWGLHGRSPEATLATKLSGRVDDPTAATLPAGLAPPAGAGEPGAFLIEPDPAVIAADGTDDLAEAHGLWRIEPGHVWLTGDAPAETPLAACFEIIETVPGREKDVGRALRRLDAGVVEVKPRGVQLDTDRLQRSLRGRGGQTLSVLWTRRGASQVAFIAVRCQPYRA